MPVSSVSSSGYNVKYNQLGSLFELLALGILRFI